MCWNGKASTVLAVIGLSTTLYAAWKKEPTALWITLGYFSLMEALQAYTYLVINQCSVPSNQIATLLGYLHIVFQPFFANAMALYFIPDKVRDKIQGWVYAACFASAIFMLIQLYPFDWAGHCAIGRPLCGDVLCSVRGNWHIAWEVPANSIGNWLWYHHVPIIWNGYPSYPLVVFLLPALYGSWRLTLYHAMMGPILSHILTNNPNEWPAVWCLLSIGMLLIVVKTPVRQYMFVRHWFFWPRRLWT